ncbi:hypothetical protein N7492_006200 [Penicillium capsulatum]|uniref:Uncharacterized protein n=1 Tax=Penicillium capsulatum TaxID=69766 RepID=A0A9W9I3N3_9EURO|nr:hypothetical protein N7492_006200 [Penicillium capsulatum]KAJ6108852.1 hypothetical protein N7512_008689 [Penicillium capsulatum]
MAVILDTIEENRFIRILGDMPTEQLNCEDYLASTRGTIEQLISFWQNKADLRLLALEVWPQYSYFALDFNNDKYDYEYPSDRRTCYLLRLSRKSNRWRIFRHRPEDASLAKRIADLHEDNGNNPIPFVEDYIKGVTHLCTPKASKHG